MCTSVRIAGPVRTPPRWCRLRSIQASKLPLYVCYYLIWVLNLTLATRWKCQASVGRLDYGWHCDFCQDWEVKWSWIYRPHAVSALTMAVLRDCCCHRINQWRRDVTPVYIWTVSCELWAVNHLYIPCNCEPCAVSCEFETTINCGPVN